MNLEEAANYSQLPSLQNSSFQYIQLSPPPLFFNSLYVSAHPLTYFGKAPDLYSHILKLPHQGPKVCTIGVSRAT